ncbi:hypothetical protein ABFS82_12G106500 [Erythranthe guttata]|uniref:cucumisin-like isoform X1 n=1 Tax=Erythranthe guttata TaxID=4155 RepID=UPI00064DD4C9|nr:PREDICTED: cucumisin-like isoform X1 [Erythranthe guttata]|eukprot:XP_012847556.1 PREDICTED: cucumisin-like isoform X1 [Erythranthe guttata]
MDKLQCFFLFIICNLICRCLSDATDDKRQVYVVYMGALPEGYHSLYHSNKLQEHHAKMLQDVVPRDTSLTKALVTSYKRSFNGFAAYLTNQEQQKLASHEDVVSIFPSRTLWPQTTRSWDFIGLNENVIRNSNTDSSSNIVIGVLDSGIWPESESFNDQGFGPVPQKWRGVCNGGTNFTCNKKLIGARFYSSDTARDTIGHGTHTASTAAGNYVKDASFYGIAQGTARGGAPSARIAAYKVCQGGCREADILAAFDDAIADGVDVITISLGSSVAVDVIYDSISIGSLHAMEKGILTVHSAGNNGFSPGTVISVAPWLMTVGASSIDRGIVAKVVLGNGKTISGKAVNSFKMKGTEFPLVYGKDVRTGDCDELAGSLCSTDCLNSSLVSGKIVLCDSNSGIEEALNAGALGTIVKPGQVPDVSFVVPMSASVLIASDFELVKSYINSTEEAKAIVSTSESMKNSDAPVVASFSSKGPNPIISSILKPDITAPGVEILAAYSPAAPVTDYLKDKRSVEYSVLSGTSMSSPHAAGAAAYVKSAHPDWSPSAIKSALMTTAWRMDPTRHKDAEFSYGSGHINPINATNPGLVYETSREDYIKLLCSIGYSAESIRQLFKDNSIDCSKFKKVDSTNKDDFNYPSMTVKVAEGAPFSATFSRTVTNVGLANSTYTAAVDKSSDCNITVDPQTLSFKQLNEKQSFVVTVKGDRMKSMVSASLVWSDGIHLVRSPIVVY